MRRRRFIGMYRGLRKSMAAVAPRQKASESAAGAGADRDVVTSRPPAGADPSRSCCRAQRGAGKDAQPVEMAVEGDGFKAKRRRRRPRDRGVAAALRPRYIRAELSRKPREADDDLRRPQGLLREEVRP